MIRVPERAGYLTRLEGNPTGLEPKLARREDPTGRTIASVSKERHDPTEIHSQNDVKFKVRCTYTEQY